MDTKAKILLVEDDFNLGAITKRRLEEAGFTVEHCIDGDVAWKEFQRTMYDICLLDVVMPKKDGFALAQLIRKKNDFVPILFLTSRSQDEDKIAGFKNGADDYVTKPFSMQELLLRIEVFLKRTRPLNADKRTQFKLGSILFDYGELKLIALEGDKKVKVLTQKEADLLKFLCENANKTLKREEILYHVWGKDDYFLGRSMDVFITKIRKNFPPDSPVKLETLHGIGFKFHMPKEELPEDFDINAYLAPPSTPKSKADDDATAATK
ncbi:DNA-binding response OmpR family regulator [Chitinophaga skermanii]|uniref:DNA-binding response OmpR family regulator n=1 Tax=Chitinophaga skermanii TaxID=331697 RepID=A0A327QII8_9BACT|nr:response regulator transcription factor [Chitinophaga skermanii]RAJ04170.1 DNA-binding response OmpR family regulator [Chitinophaga skermanii]